MHISGGGIYEEQRSQTAGRTDEPAGERFAGRSEKNRQDEPALCGADGAVLRGGRPAADSAERPGDGRCRVGAGGRPCGSRRLAATPVLPFRKPGAAGGNGFRGGADPAAGRHPADLQPERHEGSFPEDLGPFPDFRRLPEDPVCL